MNLKTFIYLRILIGVLIAGIVAVAVTYNNFYLAISGVLVGILLMSLMRKKFNKVLVDERITSISGMASRMAYVIVAVFLAVSGLFLTLSGRADGNVYVESIGILFSYVTMLLLGIYAVSYYYFNHKYGGDK